MRERECSEGLKSWGMGGGNGYGEGVEADKIGERHAGWVVVG